MSYEEGKEDDSFAHIPLHKSYFQLEKQCYLELAEPDSKEGKEGIAKAQARCLGLERTIALSVALIFSVLTFQACIYILGYGGS